MTKLNYYYDIFKLYRHNAKKTWGIINTLIGRCNDKTTIYETFKINNSIITNHDTIAVFSLKLVQNMHEKFQNQNLFPYTTCIIVIKRVCL